MIRAKNKKAPKRLAIVTACTGRSDCASRVARKEWFDSFSQCLALDMARHSETEHMPSLDIVCAVGAMVSKVQKSIRTQLPPTRGPQLSCTHLTTFVLVITGDGKPQDSRRGRCDW